jgi:hypothetical protein
MKTGKITATLGALTLLAACGGGGDSSSSGYMAEVMCEGFVKDRLKSPSSAEFDTSFTGSGPTYTVTGTVDSQNSFGAMVRNEFSCTVRHDGDGGWQLVQLEKLG